jgi:hypothetical protein
MVHARTKRSAKCGGVLTTQICTYVDATQSGQCQLKGMTLPTMCHGQRAATEAAQREPFISSHKLLKSAFLVLLAIYQEDGIPSATVLSLDHGRNARRQLPGREAVGGPPLQNYACQETTTRVRHVTFCRREIRFRVYDGHWPPALISPYPYASAFSVPMFLSRNADTIITPLGHWSPLQSHRFSLLFLDTSGSPCFGYTCNVLFIPSGV